MLKKKVEKILVEVKNKEVKLLELDINKIKWNANFIEYTEKNKIYNYVVLQVLINDDLKQNGVNSAYLKFVKSFKEIELLKFNYYKLNDETEKIDGLTNEEVISLWFDNTNHKELVELLEKDHLIKYEIL